MSTHSTGVIIGAALLVIAWIFIAPLIIAHAWTLFAVGMFGAPAITYWTSFYVTWAIHILFGGTSAFTSRKSS
jgi:hypothetical protein